MRSGLYIAAAMIVAALTANLLLADPGYVALRFAGRLIEMSAVTFVLVLLLAYVGLLYLTYQSQSVSDCTSRRRGLRPSARSSMSCLSSPKQMTDTPSRMRSAVRYGTCCPIPGCLR